MPIKVVCDPQIPHKVARQLAEADLHMLIPFSAAPGKPNTVGQKFESAQFRAKFFAYYALILWCSFLILLSSPEAATLAFFALVTTAVATWQWWDGRTHLQPALLHKYHRRYVVPRSDLDPEAGQVWDRALRAADAITGSQVVKEQRADWIRLSSVLPHWLWEIAERLALLSEVRSRQRAILPGLASGVPEITEILDQQRRAQDIASADIERRVRRLEALAGWATRADGAIRTLRTMPQLTALNGAHAELLARTAHTGAVDAHEAEGLARDLQAIIAQADDAVRQVIEATNILPLPDE